MKPFGICRKGASRMIVSALACCIMVPATGQVSYSSFTDNRYLQGTPVVFLSSAFQATEAPEPDETAAGLTKNTYSPPGLTGLKDPGIRLVFRPTGYQYPANPSGDPGVEDYSEQQLMLYAAALKEYAIAHDFDGSYALLGNMGMRCNKKRLFLVNLETMEIEASGLVAHGRGKGLSMFSRQYSDEPGSRCTSLGRYKISDKYNGSYGTAYRMDGLDPGNGNARDRSIVLHGMGCIPDQENRMPACVSDGCPAVAPGFLTALGRIIDTRTKPMLLWLFDSNLEEVVAEEVPERISAAVLSSLNGQKKNFDLPSFLRLPSPIQKIRASRTSTGYYAASASSFSMIPVLVSLPGHYLPGGIQDHALPSFSNEANTAGTTSFPVQKNAMTGLKPVSSLVRFFRERLQ